MKKELVTGGSIVAAGVAFLVLELNAITDPYVVKPLSIMPAPPDAKIGHTIDAAARTLSVVSRKEVVVVADPGASFSHEVLWLLERPRQTDQTI